MITTTMTWHPMLSDMFGIKINHRYVAVNLKAHNCNCITKEGSYPMIYEESFHAYLEHQNVFVQELLDNDRSDFHLVFDFKNQRVNISNRSKDIIEGSDNTLLDESVMPQCLMNQDAGKELTMHWLHNVNFRSRISIDYHEDDHAQILNLKHWREKQVAVG